MCGGERGGGGGGGSEEGEGRDEEEGNTNPSSPLGLLRNEFPSRTPGLAGEEAAEEVRLHSAKLKCRQQETLYSMNR